MPSTLLKPNFSASQGDINVQCTAGTERETPQIHMRVHCCPKEKVVTDKLGGATTDTKVRYFSTEKEIVTHLYCKTYF